MQIYGLYLHWLESMSTPYLLVTSCSEEKLKNILKNIIKDDTCTYTIDTINLYVVSKCKNGNILFKKTFHYDEEFIKNKIYGMNLCSSSSVDQVLLKIFHDSEENSKEYQLFVQELRNHELFKTNDFSSRSIKFDEYYDEGILNA